LLEWSLLGQPTTLLPLPLLFFSLFLLLQFPYDGLTILTGRTFHHTPHTLLLLSVRHCRLSRLD
jgi:hypothetical protein